MVILNCYFSPRKAEELGKNYRGAYRMAGQLTGWKRSAMNNTHHDHLAQYSARSDPRSGPFARKVSDYADRGDYVGNLDDLGY